MFVFVYLPPIGRCMA